LRWLAYTTKPSCGRNSQHGFSLRPRGTIEESDSVTSWRSEVSGAVRRGSDERIG
jgi:hypothetical protein